MPLIIRPDLHAVPGDGPGTPIRHRKSSPANKPSAPVPGARSLPSGGSGPEQKSGVPTPGEERW